MQYITLAMNPFIILAVLVWFMILASICSRSGRRRRTRKAQARMWREAEARGEISILDDRGSDRPTLAMKRGRD
ncbi:hypothetical protein KSD_48000 [Ktedonobacter sp. SOSP1-85]|uniref:hypothetical protein n=1 Tax=Ktedonobacter sp. SOSP1-85 TaxID=2778367 RepID=UPI0019167BD1|nr:hypothetical protein [Ktedonobacter sp. SOSP1-85]GHO77029.1 hypothetical protein KSD_48000 [Ktedonobacter sp. SOSP1-85]